MGHLEHEEYKRLFNRKVARVHYRNGLRARRYGVRNTLTVEQVRDVLLGDHCHYCGVQLLGFYDKTLDHMTPMCRGGDNSVSNVVLCCDYCNKDKKQLAYGEYNLLVRHAVNEVKVLRV